MSDELKTKEMKKATNETEGKVKKRSPKEQKTKRQNLSKQLDAIKEELEKVKDQYLRSLAEFENYKKRRDRDFSNLVEYANTTLIENLLPILDDFDRSLNSHQNQKASKSFRDGIELIYNKFQSILNRQGVEAIHAIGEPFNPELHEAIMQIETKDHSPNTIVEEATKGYKLKDKVIRHSKVVVSK